MPEPIRIMLAAGGTGGHVFPAIAVADAIREQAPDTEFLFAGTRDRMEWHAVPEAGYPISSLWISGFHRRWTLKNALFPLKLLFSIGQSYRMIKRFKPHAVISCGGFVAGPPGWVATKRGIPLYLQEQNSFPGVTNRKLAGKAKRIFIAFENALKWLPEKKCTITGNPVRKSLVEKAGDPQAKSKGMAAFELKPDKPVVLIMGGSGGARSMNQAMLEQLDVLHDQHKIQIIWQCGDTYLREVKATLFEKGRSYDKYKNLRLFGFMSNISDAWAAADLVVSRAGATTCAELLATAKPGILVPSPWVAGDHQTHNARALQEIGAAQVLKDEELSAKMTSLIVHILKDSGIRNRMEERARKNSPENAAEKIASVILSDIRQLQEKN
ncbi:undecaprenyldiphospho-muramoylpentapeptide beta-N-acetylglucosaminyltransferase [Balneolaceae bacterium ANBcel3]|nr:undecaprenyldiphospho-muramoylpentapeptide beta-N-acetylglucosaminyltransferase [Balneolaceae bacterium ANBcel3]